MSSLLFILIISILSACSHRQDSKEKLEISNGEGIESLSDISTEVKFLKSETMHQMDHSIWDGLLKKYVSDNLVDYTSWHRDQKELNEYIHQLSSNHPRETWSRNAKLAYWINAYNAFTVKLILDHYPVKSIMDIHGGKPWDVIWIQIGNKKYSLNQIEHEIIRPEFGEPRIHFAVNCAALSCPPLGRTAFTEKNIENLLDKQTREFIGNKQMNTIGKNKLEISQIFEWYREDFTSLISFIQKYSSISIDPGAIIHFKEYDWALNSR